MEPTVPVFDIEVGKREGGVLLKAKGFFARRRASLRDLGMLAVGMVVLAFVVFEVDIFVTEGQETAAQRTLELDEVLLLGGIMAVGLLAFSVRRYFDQKREMARRVAAERLARELAYQDPLTGLANRRQFEEALRTAAASPPTAGSSHAVLMLDLNGFKQINDTYGHGTGDELLVIVAQRLLRAVREGDLVARLGGDEFVVLSQHLMGPEAASSIALRIIEGFSEPILTGRVGHHIGAGLGIALLPGDAQTAAEAIRKADVALYRAKAERRSAFRFFEEDMDRLVKERERMERELERALGEARIQPRFRPTFDLRTGAVVGFEAVPAWLSAEGGEVPPERFLPIAEETGLIHALARHILARACAAATQWPQTVTLSIAVLPSQLKDRELASGMLAVLDEAGFSPGRLEIEIAESTIVHDLDAARLALGPLRIAGVSIALGNFGTGYSNLHHMQEFRIDKVKIDRRFTESLGDEDAARMVRALAGLGHGLGLTVSADGFAGAAANAELLESGVVQGQSGHSLMSQDEARELAGMHDRGRSPR
ncbi:EAL domain-containing protein [Aureimonas altamirensis]|uniref:putative bifunctional diguanylate cyclase/phosphodiesterase n=1 Tax=Aureimonas altamirensis TaxID=370622 RepID=UPI001E291306|nr:EAL domain-containing protein [Aureimonas altamirensis]UHD45769.1 EAL domain-containing protein [Aureimonas altamirensis]